MGKVWNGYAGPYSGEGDTIKPDKASKMWAEYDRATNANSVVGRDVSDHIMEGGEVASESRLRIKGTEWEDAGPQGQTRDSSKFGFDGMYRGHNHPQFRKHHRAQAGSQGGGGGNQEISSSKRADSPYVNQKPSKNSGIDGSRETYKGAWDKSPRKALAKTHRQSSKEGSWPKDTYDSDRKRTKVRMGGRRP